MNREQAEALDAVIDTRIDEIAVLSGGALSGPATELNNDEGEDFAGSVHARLLIGLLRHGRLRQDQANFAAYAWSYSQHPQDATTDDEWRALFQFAGYLVDSHPAERPNGECRLFRGSTDDRRTRWSWTDDRAQALPYADGSRGRLVGGVWTVIAPSSRLFAHFRLRGESEYIVDVSGLDIRPATT